jgi:hypothetical protein
MRAPLVWYWQHNNNATTLRHPYCVVHMSCGHSVLRRIDHVHLNALEVGPIGYIFDCGSEGMGTDPNLATQSMRICFVLFCFSK